MAKNKYTLDDLWRMQAYDLDKKIAITKTRIIDFYNSNRGRIYVAFSGGKDSTVLLDIVRKIYPDTLAVFVDTGMEYPENREFVKSKENVKILYPVDYSNETKKFERTNFKKVLEKYGYPVMSKEISGKIEQRRRDIKKGINDNNLAVETENNKDIPLKYYPKGNCYVAVRKLTPKEYFRLQGFNDEYYERAAFVNSKSRLYKQAGNGVTTTVVQAIGEKLNEQDL